MQDALVASERIFFLLDKCPSMKSGTISLPQKIETISFNNVSLSYGEKRALNDVSLEAKAGEMIALIGDSGGGKSF